MAIYTPSMWNEKDRRTDDLVSAAKKLEAPYLVTKMDQLIGSLVRERDPMLETSLRYMNAERDSREFALLTKNYGLGNPLKLGFIPLMERHVKALQGQFQEYPFPFSVAATDRESINVAAEEWAAEATRRVAQLINEAVKNWNPGAAAAPQAAPGEGQSGQPQPAAATGGPPTLSERTLEQIAEDGESFKSNAELLAQRLVEGMVRRYHIKNEVSQFVNHYCVGSRLHYRVWLEEKGRLCKHSILEPGSLHYDRGQPKKPIREKGRAVLHERVSRAQALAEHGHLMNAEERDLISGRKQGGMDGVEWIPLRAGQERSAPKTQDGSLATDGNYLDTLAIRRAGLNAGDMDQLVDRYHCEWIATNKVDDIEDADELTDDQLLGQAGVIEFGKKASKKAEKNDDRRRMDRYEGWRYGNSMYLATGRSLMVSRSVDDPFTCYLTYNGLDLNVPSLVYKSKDLQDKYDILSYQQDNLIAQGGVPGVAQDINDIPHYLGKTMGERVLKYRAMVKSGLALTDRNQSGSGSTEPGVAPSRGEINNTLGKIDTSFNGQSVAAIQNQMSQLEERASMLSGVPRQMLAEIKERDGMGTTQQAMDSAGMVSRPMYTDIYSVIEQLLTDMVNLNVLSAQSNPFVLQSLIGTTGMQLLAQATHGVPLADFNVSFEDPMEEKQILDRVRQAGQILAQSQAIDPESIIDTAASRSSVELMHKLRKNLNKKTQQTIADLQNQLTQAQGELQKAQGQLQQVDQAKMQLEQSKVQATLQIGMGGVQNQTAANQNTAAFNSAKIDLEQKRVDLEKEQLYAEAANGEEALGGAAEIKND